MHDLDTPKRPVETLGDAPDMSLAPSGGCLRITHIQTLDRSIPDVDRYPQRESAAQRPFFPVPEASLGCVH